MQECDKDECHCGPTPSLLAAIFYFTVPGRKSEHAMATGFQIFGVVAFRTVAGDEILRDPIS